MKICPIILAGGSGTRLWPISRAMHPKQFLGIKNNNETMLQATVRRLSGLRAQAPITICNEEHRFFVADQLKKIDSLGPIILEPVGKNTAPAIALASLEKEEQDPILLVLAADHVIEDDIEFIKSVNNAIPLAEDGKLVTFGIIPTKAHTGYGYIKKGKKEENSYKVKKFFEKPSAKNAKNYYESDDYLWNSGMFLFKASSYLKEIKNYRSDIYSICLNAMKNKSTDLDFIRIDKDLFSKCPSESIDYAVMEKTENSVVVPMDAGWNDIGSWSSLWDTNAKDKNNNSSQGDVILHNTKNSYVRSNERLIATIGLDNIVVVDTKDAVLVANKDQVEDVKFIAQQLKSKGRPEWQLHREVYRPWGKYDSIDSDNGYQVKRLTVNPGAKLSVQMHYHRSEHWVVVSGTARVHYGEEILDLVVNQSTYHGKEVVHALENCGDVPLELIEVQVGSYLEEDDIVRFDDVYGRN